MQSWRNERLIDPPDSAGPRRIRLGYMGHLNLIAEETAKLLERYPQEIASKVEHTIPQPQWNNLLQHLQLTRQKESAPLAGGRPAMSMSLGGSGLGGYGASAEGGECSVFVRQLPKSDDAAPKQKKTRSRAM